MLVDAPWYIDPIEANIGSPSALLRCIEGVHNRETSATRKNDEFRAAAPIFLTQRQHRMLCAQGCVDQGQAINDCC